MGSRSSQNSLFQLDHGNPVASAKRIGEGRLPRATTAEAHYALHVAILAHRRADGERPCPQCPAPRHGERSLIAGSMSRGNTERELVLPSG